jgi:Flp pilus assembly protein TadG
MIGYWLKKLAKDDSGVSAVEFALTAPVLMVSVLGVVDIGNIVYQRSDMEAALRSGIQYFMNGGDDLSRAEAVVTGAWTTKPDTVTIVADRFCLCDATPHACNVLCDDDTYPASYNRVRATATFPGILMENSQEANQSVRVR